MCVWGLQWRVCREYRPHTKNMSQWDPSTARQSRVSNNYQWRRGGWLVNDFFPLLFCKSIGVGTFLGCSTTGPCGCNCGGIPPVKHGRLDWKTYMECTLCSNWWTNVTVPAVCSRLKKSDLSEGQQTIIMDNDR